MFILILAQGCSKQGTAWSKTDVNASCTLEHHLLGPHRGQMEWCSSMGSKANFSCSCNCHEEAMSLVIHSHFVLFIMLSLFLRFHSWLWRYCIQKMPFLVAIEAWEYIGHLFWLCFLHCFLWWQIIKILHHLSLKCEIIENKIFYNADMLMWKTVPDLLGSRINTIQTAGQQSPTWSRQWAQASISMVPN